MTDDNLPDVAETIDNEHLWTAEADPHERQCAFCSRPMIYRDEEVEILPCGANGPRATHIRSLLESLSARVTQAETKLATVVNLLGKMPIQSAASAKEPVVTLNMIDLTKVIEVAKGETDPSEWVSMPCVNTAKFGHSPHHWSEYREGQVPLRVAHYCDGIEIRDASPGTGNEKESD